jgi:hypothetical protein
MRTEAMTLVLAKLIPTRIEVEVAATFLVMFITMITPTSVYPQTTDDDGSTQKWCENKKDELKDRLLELILLAFTDGATYNMTVEISDTATILAAEIEEKMIDCVDYLTGSDMQTLQQMHNAAVFFTEMADTVLNAFGGSERNN